MMYSEHAFLDRFAAAAGDGFAAVEFLFPYEWPAAAIGELLAAHRLRQVLFNAPPGDFAKGERGIGCLPGREAEFRSGFARALEYAAALDCPRLHVMAGLVPRASNRAALRATYLANLAWAAREAADAGVDVLIEPINTRDIPGYFLNRQDEAHAVLAELDTPHLKVQMDLYHCQIVEGDVATKLRKYLPGGKVGHLQIAGVPDRHEPDVGELDFGYLFGVIDELEYDGWIGCEYRPAAATSAGLGWLHRQRQAAAAGAPR
jgi:hydroxypyruvate isomerase